MYIKNIVEKQKNVKINPRYDISCRDIDDIYRACSDPFELIFTAFRTGYMQGEKAEKAKERKERA